VIIVPSLSHEFEPWQWSGYLPSWVDVSILAGSFGWFSMWFLLFIKYLPVIAIAEVKEIVPPRLRSHAPRADIDVTGHHVDYSPETPGERD
jgi:molybdopterin-containing oxidoreductase family membrane subunit